MRAREGEEEGQQPEQGALVLRAEGAWMLHQVMRNLASDEARLRFTPRNRARWSADTPEHLFLTE